MSRQIEAHKTGDCDPYNCPACLWEAENDDQEDEEE